MELTAFLQMNRGEIVGLALGSLSRAPLEFFKEEGHTISKERIRELFDLTLKSIETKNYLPLIDFSESLAKERYEQYHDLHDVQIAFNVLEEEIWKKIIEEYNPKEYQDSLALVTTIIGLGKEMLAATYGNLSSEKVYIKPFEFGQVALAF
jgi:hypothetical protein